MFLIEKLNYPTTKKSEKLFQDLSMSNICGAKMMKKMASFVNFSVERNSRLSLVKTNHLTAKLLLQITYQKLTE